MAVKPPTSVPKSSPYYYGGNVAPVQSLNVTPKKIASTPQPGRYDNPGPILSGGVAPPTGTVGTPGDFTAPAVDKPAPKPSTPGSWFTPDYDALLAGDWEPANAAITGREKRDSAEANFQEQFRRAYIDNGGDISAIPTEMRKYIDDATIEAAKTNKFSTMAQNLLALQRTTKGKRALLAAKGSEFSGQNTEMTRRALLDKELADYTANRTFLGGAREGLQGLSTVEMQIRDMIDEANSRAAARIAQTNPKTWIPGTGDYAYMDPGEAAAAAAAPPAPKPFAGVQWGGHTVFTKADLQKALGYNQNINTWAQQHPAAWNQLT